MKKIKNGRRKETIEILQDSNLMDQIIEIKKNFNFTLQRVYIFIFFQACNLFLTWWISTTLILFFPFAILGLIFYIFTALFHIATIKIIERKEPLKKEMQTSVRISIFLIILISLCVLYILGVYGIQWLTIKYMHISKQWFSWVSWGLSILSIFISFAISFINRDNKNGSFT